MSDRDTRGDRYEYMLGKTDSSGPRDTSPSWRASSDSGFTRHLLRGHTRESRQDPGRRPALSRAGAGYELREGSARPTLTTDEGAMGAMGEGIRQLVDFAETVVKAQGTTRRSDK